MPSRQGISSIEALINDVIRAWDSWTSNVKWIEDVLKGSKDHWLSGTCRVLCITNADLQMVYFSGPGSDFVFASETVFLVFSSSTLRSCIILVTILHHPSNNSLQKLSSLKTNGPPQNGMRYGIHHSRHMAGCIYIPYPPQGAAYQKFKKTM